MTFALSSHRLSGVDKQKETGALLIAASIVATVSLRGDAIKPSPRLTGVVRDSVELARAVLAELQR